MAPGVCRRQQTTTDLRSLCRNSHISPAEYTTVLHSGIHWMYWMYCYETLTSRITPSHPYSEQLLDFSVRNPILSSPVLLGTFVSLALNKWNRYFSCHSYQFSVKNKVYCLLWGVYFFLMQCREAWGHVCLLAWPQQSSGVCRVRCHVSHHKEKAPASTCLKEAKTLAFLTICLRGKIILKWFFQTVAHGGSEGGRQLVWLNTWPFFHPTSSSVQHCPQMSYPLIFRHTLFNGCTVFYSWGNWQTGCAQGSKEEL